jgi:TRAP-type C4-dicarboxylate transport system permease small subunit
LATIDRVLDRLTRGIELVLAYAFIVAVALNFGNVVGRYGFGRMMLGADEIQIYIMVCMAFLGAAVISWRREHLRMDVLFKLFPRPVRSALRAIEMALVLVLAGFVLDQSFAYALRVFNLGQTSNTAGVPMWIPHSAIWLGFGLMGLIALWQAVKAVRTGSVEQG